MITRRDLVVATVAACTAIAAVAVAQSASKPVMGSSVFEWDNLTVQQTKSGARRQVFRTPTATLDEFECHVTTLNPGEAPHPPHQHPQEEMMIIKEGTVESIQNGVTNRVGPGSILFQASNQMHGLRNAGSTTASYYVFQWFPPGMLKTRTN
jgi:XRE family transcriptional regulator, regulator of sulfur utilization